MADDQRAAAQPPGVGVVKYEDPVVFGQPDIALDARTSLERGGKGDQAVFRELRTEVQPAVREARGAWIEWIRP